MDLTFAFDPVLVQLGPLQLGWHGIFSAVAVLVALTLADRLARRRGIPTDVVYTVATWGFVGGVLGARLFHVADHLDSYVREPLLVFAIWEGGIAVYGAFIGGLIAGGIAAWRVRHPVWPLLDVAAPAMLVGQAVGRLGCLANGDAWGAPAADCTWCITIRYTHPNDLLPAELLFVPTHAYPLYELAAALVLLGLLWVFYERLATQPGRTFLLAAVGYALIRFGLSYLRQEAVLAFGLQEAQLIAVVTGVLAALVLAWRTLRVAPPVSKSAAT